MSQSNSFRKQLGLIHLDDFYGVLHSQLYLFLSHAFKSNAKCRMFACLINLCTVHEFLKWMTIRRQNTHNASDAAFLIQVRARH